MQIFEGNDAFLSTEYIEECLRSRAKETAREGEYHPEEHILWIAADAINKLVAIVEGEAPEVMLRRLADELERNKMENKK
jgi:hypothetical protein